MKACPSCKSESRHRLKRRGLTRHIPGFRAYECDKCSQTYLWHSVLNSSFKTKYK